MRRTKEAAERTRQNIFDAGLRVFSRKGFAATTMKDIAAEAGITRGAIYWHFRNKEEFFTEIVSRLSNYHEAILNSATEGDLPFPETIRSTFEAMLRRFPEDDQWRAMQEIIIRLTLNREELPALQSKRADYAERGYRLIEQAMRDGDLFSEWDPSTAIFCIVSMVSGLFLQMTKNGKCLTEREVREIAGFVVRGLSPVRGTAGSDPQKEGVTS